MLVSFGLASLILAGFVILKLCGGSYHDWVYAVFIASLLAGNMFLRGKLGRGMIFVFICFILLICAKLWLNSALDDLWHDVPSIRYEYYGDKFIWRGRVRKKISIGGMAGSRVTVYDRQGNVTYEGPLIH
jgi:hypothetical protein